MTGGSESKAVPPCALLVMCNQCGRGIEVLLPIDREVLIHFLALHAWFIALLTPPGHVPILFSAICGECAPKIFSPEILQAAEVRRQKLLQGQQPGTP